MASVPSPTSGCATVRRSAGATASTYLLGNADVDARISVQVSYTDAHGTFESLTSAATSPVVNVNDAPTGAPVVTGTATERQTLTADTSSIADADGLGAFAYQWLRDGQRGGRCHRQQLPARQCRRRRPHQRAGLLHRRPRHAREPDQRSDLAGGQRQRHAHRRTGGHRHRHRAPDAHRRHFVDRRRRRPRHLRLPVAARRPSGSRCHRQHLPARQCRRRRPHQRAGLLHRRPRHVREPDQRSDLAGGQRQRHAYRRAGRSPAPPPSARRSPPTPRRSPTPTASAPSPTSGCATATSSPMPPPAATCSATTMSLPR